MQNSEKDKVKKMTFNLLTEKHQFFGRITELMNHQKSREDYRKKLDAFREVVSHYGVEVVDSILDGIVEWYRGKEKCSLDLGEVNKKFSITDKELETFDFLLLQILTSKLKNMDAEYFSGGKGFDQVSYILWMLSWPQVQCQKGCWMRQAVLTVLLSLSWCNGLAILKRQGLFNWDDFQYTQNSILIDGHNKKIA